MVRRLAIFITAALLLGLAFTATTTASHVAPVTFPGNDSCTGTKIQPVVSGTYALIGGGHVVITVIDTASGPTFNFDTQGSALVSAVTVKGGPNYNLYTYSPAVTADTGLHSPVNPNNDKFFGLSHLCFASEKKDAPEPPK